MPSFDSNDDPLRLNEAAGDPRERRGLCPRLVPRTRSLPTRACVAARVRSTPAAELAAVRPVRSARRVRGARASAFARPSRRSLRLLASCRGLPGSPS